MGRRQLEKERSVEIIGLRVTTKQKEMIENEAEKRDLNTGEFIRHCIKKELGEF